MKQTIFTLTLAAILSIAIISCGSTRAGAGGSATGVGVNTTATSVNPYDLVPVGDRITYTIDISTPEGKQKLNLNIAQKK